MDFVVANVYDTSSQWVDWHADDHHIFAEPQTVVSITTAGGGLFQYRWHRDSQAVRRESGGGGSPAEISGLAWKSTGPLIRRPKKQCKLITRYTQAEWPLHLRHHPRPAHSRSAEQSCVWHCVPVVDEISALVATAACVYQVKTSPCGNGRRCVALCMYNSWPILQVRHATSDPPLPRHVLHLDLGKLKPPAWDGKGQGCVPLCAGDVLLMIGPQVWPHA